MFDQVKELLSLEQDAVWVSQIFIVILVTLVIAAFVSIFMNRLYRQTQKTKNYWDDAIIDALRSPLKVLIWIVGITFAVEIVYQESGTAILKAVYPFRDISVIGTLCWFVNRTISRIEYSMLHREDGKSADPTTVGAIGKVLKASVIITTGLIILQTLGFSISGVLAFGGVSGVAVGFAAKDMLSNFFGAIMIYLDKPFKVGDWVRSPDRDIEGTVEKIGWRQTCIRTFDKRPLYVPNSMFSTISVENPSRMTNRRIYETIGVRYDDVAVIAQIVDDVKSMLQSHEAIDTKQTMIVNVNAFAPSSIDFFVYTFTKTTDWIQFHEIKQDVMLQIASIIDARGAQMAFPTSTVHVPDTVQLQQVSVES